MSRDYPVVKEPVRRYPLPQNLNDLDEPWYEEEHNRHARVDLFRKGHEPTDDPLKKKPNISPSNILSKL